ncbi:ABC transporter permease [Erythrobacter sp. sf7]|uniref:ABC transporter permease n=1 Tax=Erythrobacter fulvus TaxID=2987523 RepID=A0ABT5JPB6_9SPHN|nr:ABC transporter permease [Erythrobacter fulvus]MDC8754628.1 ABC transporter permease [Erythrobacter fulvus]
MKALDRKLLNDLWHLRGQVLAISVVLAAASAIYVLSAGTHASLTRARDVYYAQNGFADVFAEMTRAPADIVERAAVIPGVARAEGGIRQLAMIDMPGTDAPMRAVVNSIDDRRARRINRITLKSGRLPLPDAADEIIADEAFAEANALGPGDRVAAVIYGKRQDLRIVGIGLAPDHIFSIAPGDLVPDNSRFGVLWMGQRALEAATDRVGGINTLVLTLSPDAVPREVIRQLDHLLAPYGGTGAYVREDQISHALLDSELKQLDALTRVIPPVFLVVATFLVLVVLSRLIRTERAQIGLMKAFGYANAAVGWHYAKFALVIAVLASVIGCGAGVWMGHAMTDLYARYYRFPVLEYRLDPTVFLIAVVLALGASLLGALVGARSAVGITPAQALAPPPPPIYHDGPLERLAVRARLSPAGLMIIRHIARWPARAAMTAGGVALSLGLLFATLQFHDSSSHMIRTFFIRAQAQDLTVTLPTPVTRRHCTNWQNFPA